MRARSGRMKIGCLAHGRHSVKAELNRWMSLDTQRGRRGIDIEKKPLSIREAMSWFHLEMMRALARSKNQEAEKDP